MPSYLITTPDGQKYKITAETDEQANAAVSDILASVKPAEKTSTGFATRENREAEMPSTPELERETAIAERMARRRRDAPIGAGDMMLQDYTFGLRDEVVGASAGIGTALTGEGYSEGYEIAKEADKRLRAEYAEQNPKTATAASVGGMVLGGVGKAVQAPQKALMGLQTLKPSMAARTTGQTIKEGIAVGGSQGAIHGAAEGDEGPYGRLGGAAFEGTIGSVIGGAVPGAIALGQKAAQPFVNAYRAFTKPEQEAAKRIDDALRADRGAGAGLSDAQYDAAVAAGKPVALMDRGGEKTQGLSRWAADNSPEGRQAMLNVDDPRYATQSSRIVDAVDKQSKFGGRADEAMDAAREANKKATAPAYQKAYELGNESVWDDTLDGLAQTPAMQAALKKAVTSWRNKAALDPWMRQLRMFNPPVSVNEVGDLVFQKGGLPSYPNLRLWDHAKRALDDMAAEAASKGNKDAAKDLAELSRTLRNHLDSLGEMGQAYKAARATAANMFGADNAFEAGINFASQKGMSAREAVKGLSKMKPEERALFKEGYLQALKDKLRGLGDSRDAARAILNSDETRDAARVALGKNGLQQLQAEIAVENAMAATRRSISGNSKTARYLQEAGLFGAAGAGTGMMGGDQMDMSIAGAVAAGTRFGGRQANAKLAKAVGEMLASNDPKKVQALIKQAERNPKVLHVLQSIGALRPGLVSAGSIGATQAVSQ